MDFLSKVFDVGKKIAGPVLAASTGNPSFLGLSGGDIAGIGAGLFSAKQTNDANRAVADQATAFNAKEASKSRAFNAREASRSRLWSKKMSNTAVRRAVTDMRKAGINPILAAKYNASTPGASTASGGAATAAMQTMNDPYASAVSSASQFKQTASNVNKQEAEITKIAQEISNLEAAQSLTEQQTIQVASIVDHLKEQIRKTVAETGLTRSKDLHQQYENITAAILTKFYQDNPAELIAKDLGIGENNLKTIIRGAMYLPSVLPPGPNSGGNGPFESYIKR